MFLPIVRPPRRVPKLVAHLSLGITWALAGTTSVFFAPAFAADDSKSATPAEDFAADIAVDDRVDDSDVGRVDESDAAFLDERVAQSGPAAPPRPRQRTRTRRQTPVSPTREKASDVTPSGASDSMETGTSGAAAAVPAATAAPSEQAPSGVASERPRWLFPDWPASGFDWGGYPVLGFRYVDDDDAQASITTMEGGLALRASGVPLKEGNPGASLEPQIGYAIGSATVKPRQGKSESGVYHRVWGGVEAPILVKFTKTTLGVRYGQINGAVVAKSRMGALTFDEGLLVLPFFATHYSYEYLRLFRKEWGQPALVANDHWLSARFFTPVLNARLAIGPAITFNKFYTRTSEDSDSTALFADTRTDSLRALAGSDLFWKLRATADARYIIDVARTEGGLIEETTVDSRLPDQGLSDAPALPLYPEDTLVTSTFLGIKGVLGGLGFGYRYTLEIFNINERSGRKQSKRESSGVGVFYEAQL